MRASTEGKQFQDRQPHPEREGRFIPFTTTSLRGHKVLALAPHPDDESLGCGGALVVHRQHQDPVKVVFLTDGARGDHTGTYDPDAYVALREQEARTACDLLGVPDVDFWRIPDRTCTPDAATIDRMVDLLQRYQPTLVYVPSLLEFHPDHQAAARLLWRAMQQAQHKAQVAFYELNRPLPINTLVDIAPVLAAKKAACQAYQSQLDQIPYADIVLALNRFRALTVSSFTTHAEGFLLVEPETIRSHSIEGFFLKQWATQFRIQDRAAPLVSIIVRTKDRPRLLQEALASVANQTYPNIEVVVVNDGGASVDRVIERFSGHLTIRSFAHDASKGRAAAANTGLEAARGAYINFLDDDDLLYPDHVAKLAGYLEQTGHSFAYSDCEQGHYTWDEAAFVRQGPRRLVGGYDFDRERLYRDNYIPVMTAMFARSLYEEAGPWDESLAALEDWDYWIRLAQLTDFHRVPGITAEYRVFGHHTHDFTTWRVAVYRKHAQHCTLDEIVAYAWSEIETLQERQAGLEAALAAREADLARVRRLWNYLPGPLRKLIRRRFPRA